MQHSSFLIQYSSFKYKFDTRGTTQSVNFAAIGAAPRKPFLRLTTSNCNNN